MQQSRADRCLFLQHKADCANTTVIQVDDTLATATDKYLASEDDESKRFVCKPRTLVHLKQPATFDDVTITQIRPAVYQLTQSEKCLPCRTLKRELVSSAAAHLCDTLAVHVDLILPLFVNSSLRTSLLHHGIVLRS